MKRSLKVIAAFLCAGTALISGCGKKSDAPVSEEGSTKKDYDIFVYNSDTDIGTSFREMCDEYTKRTGVIIRTVTPPEEENNTDNLENYLNAEHPPDIFTVNNVYELKKWKAGSYVWDFSNATEDSFKEAANSIPEVLRLSSNTSDSFGIPYTTEAFGYVADPQMLASIFGGDKYRNVISDLQECSCEDFSAFVEALKSYINSGSAYEISLNGKKYSFVQSKGDLSKNLNGVFSFAAGVSKNSGTYMMNPALASLFKSGAQANIADDTAVNELSKPLTRLCETLDLISANIAGANGPLGRGTEIVSTTHNSGTQAMKNFVNGKSLFLVACTSDYQNLSIFNQLVAKRCLFIPIKMPFSEEDITSSNTISKNLNKSLSVYVPRYYCINAKSSGAEKKKAQDFLTWLQTSELAKKYVVSDFGFTPYNIKESSVIDNPLSRSMLEYISEDRVLPGAFCGAPESWCNETMGKYLVDQLFNRANWSYEDYQKFADYGIKKWKELKN